MKILALLVTLSFVSFANAENLSCTINNPAGTTRFQILEAGQFVEHTQQNGHTVFSCGAFVNDGSVVVTPETSIVELASQACARADYSSLTYVIYCR